MEPIAKLFGSQARLKTLRLFVFNQDATLTLTDVAERTKLSKEASWREINDLLSAGIIRKKGSQSPQHYQTDSRFEHLDALDIFIRGTTNVRPKNVIKALKRAGTLRLVVLSGLFSGLMEPQIDLLIVGDNLEERIISHTVRSLEAELGREIRYASFATADFRYRLGIYDRLLRDVFDYPHRVLIDKIGV